MVKILYTHDFEPHVVTGDALPIKVSDTMLAKDSTHSETPCFDEVILPKQGVDIAW